MIACARHIGNDRHPHRWVAEIKDADHGRQVWAGQTVHAQPGPARNEAEQHLELIQAGQVAVAIVNDADFA